MKDTIYSILMFIALLVLTVSIATLPVMLLWNALMPQIFGLPHITFFEALGLSILFKLLFSPLVKDVKKEEKK